jgi:sugar/nucleoside kinase (ribokinase family)
MTQKGLFVGLITLDLIYLTQNLPEPNQKIVALDYTMAAGGPATNAAVTFRQLGNQATLLGVIGSHATKQLVLADLQQQDVAIADLNPDFSEPLPTSSILVTQATGERAVISLNAVRAQATPAQIPPDILQSVDIVLIDGHQMAVGQAIAKTAKSLNIPVVIDGGSWKPGFDQVLPWVDYAICSANFHPPGCATPDDIFAYLRQFNIPQIAITNGSQPIQYSTKELSGAIAVPQVIAVDTLGSGDIFHGAFCHFILQTDFWTALSQSAKIATEACQSFGTRQWLKEPINRLSQILHLSA